MDNPVCWYCEKNQADPVENYPEPYTVARFFKGLPDGNLGDYEYKIPRCVDCTRLHVGYAHPLKISIQVSAYIFVLSLVILPRIFDFYDDGQLLFMAFLPSLVILAGAFVYQKIRSRKVHMGVKKISDISQYPAVLAAKAQKMTFVGLDDRLHDEQKKMLTRAKKDKKSDSSNETKIWQSRLGESAGLFLLGLILTGLGTLLLVLTKAFGPEGAVMVRGSGGIGFLPINGVILHYLSLFVFGLMVVAGYGTLLVSITGIFASIFMMVVHSIRSLSSRRRAK
jgi:hypothetical protein